MTDVYVTDIESELRWLEQRITGNMREFESLLDHCPITAMSLMDKVAADRTRHFRLSMLLHALNDGWESWIDQTTDERMQAEGFQRVSPHQLLYVRTQGEPRPGIDLCDRFAIVRIEPYAIRDLISALRQR